MKKLFVTLGLVWLLLCAAGLARAEPSVLASYYLTPDTGPAGQAGRQQLDGPHRDIFQWPAPAATRKRIALMIPQLADTWRTFSYAAQQAADRLNLDLTIYTALGYTNLRLQQRQLTQRGPEYDGVLLATIDSFALGDAIDRVSAQVPVVGYANEVYADNLAAKAMVYYHDSGRRLAEWVIEHALRTRPDGPVRVAYVMGPENAGWSRDMLEGFRVTLEGNPALAGRLQVIDPLHAHTKPRMQERLIRQVLGRHADIHYLYGIAPAVERAAALRREMTSRHPDLQLVAAYINQTLFPAIKRGDVLVAASDDMLTIGKVAVARLLQVMRGEKAGQRGNGLPFVSGPEVRLITAENARDLSPAALFGPSDYTPDLRER